MKTVNIALLGCGSVGGGLVSLLRDQHEQIRRRCRVDLRLRKILVRDSERIREGVDQTLLTDDPEEVIESADLVIELLGGLEPARTMIRNALVESRNVVTANKRLLAVAGTDLHDLASVHRVRIGYEASVCGAIPIIRILRSHVNCLDVTQICGIVNGTTNYILTRMAEDSSTFAESLEEAQRLGFAEADPTLDVGGIDAAHKLKILAELAFDQRVCLDDVAVTGIEAIDGSDIESARRRGKVIRHVARAQRRGDRIEMSVAPEELPRDHPFAAVRGEENAILVCAAGAGEIFLRGKGAGSLPSASAVLGDVCDVATSN